jgi:hypothetical protein
MLRRKGATIWVLRGCGKGSEVREQQFDLYGVVGKAQQKRRLLIPAHDPLEIKLLLPYFWALPTTP